MKQTVVVSRWTAYGLMALLVCGGLTARASDATPVKETVMLGTNAIPKSVFVDDERGKDPFFPNSTRRQHKAVVPDVAPAVGPTSLVLLGIIGPPERRVALINNQTFAAGEENRVRVPGGSSLVKCVAIRERSVIVTIQGGTEQFEIQLVERTLPIAPEGEGIQ
ncbi:MAG: hypothetical protein KJ072_08580 [Verrucomicrobia bacterium]|nr:hypothetical protein [Verrucomicrobiota bacterium]